MQTLGKKKAANRLSKLILAAKLFIAMTSLCTGAISAKELQACAESEKTYGMFVAAPRVELLTPGRNIRLLEALQYADPCGNVWVSPAGSIVDGATIPRAFWSITGGPLDDTYRDASIIHDVACKERSKSWRRVHEAFYFAMLARGVELWRAKVMYAAVYHFGPTWPDIESEATEVRKPPTRKQVARFRQLAHAIEVRETASPAFSRPPMSIEEIQSWRP